MASVMRLNCFVVIRRYYLLRQIVDMYSVLVNISLKVQFVIFFFFFLSVTRPVINVFKDSVDSQICHEADQAS